MSGTNSSQFIDLVSVTFSSGMTIITDPALVSGGSIGSSSASVLASPNSIDLSRLASGAHTTLAYLDNSNAGGELTVPSEAASIIALLGNYIAAGFVTEVDGHAGTLVTEARQTEQQPLLTHPHP